MGYRGIRIGEASHPGPPFTIRTANVTSLMPHLPFVADFECDVIALQETRLTIDGQKIVNEELVKRGWTPVWGKPQPIRKGTYKSLTDAKQGGVGILIRKGHDGGPSPRTDIGEELKETGRWMSSVVKAHKSGTLLHVISLYGFPGATEGGEAAFQNEEFLRKVFDEASTLGDVPVLVCGDFNCTLESSTVLSEMTVSGKWCDAAQLYGMMNDSSIDATYFAFGGSSRIDMIFLNSAACRVFSECRVVPIPEEGIKRHKPVEAKLGLNPRREFADIIPSIRALPKGVRCMDSGTSDELQKAVLDQHLDDFNEAATRGDTEAMWDLWCRIAERFLVARAAYECEDERIFGDGRYYGRGTQVGTKRVRVGRAPPHEQRLGVDPERRELTKLSNILRELLSIRNRGHLHHISELWVKAQRLGKNCLKTHPFDKHWKEKDVPSMEGIEDVKKQVDKVLEKVTFGDRDRLLRKWRRERMERAKEGIGDLAKHFRAPEQASLKVVKLPDGSLTGNIAQMDEELRRNWLPIFAKHQNGEVPIPNATDFVHKYQDFIPRKTQVLKEIVIDDLLWVQKKLKAKGAGGLDGWRPAEVKKLPKEILELLVHLFNTIEMTGEWPTALTCAGITLIPKGDGGAPLDQRPITVTPIVYRMWAAIRMRDSTSWQEAWISSGQHGARAKHSTINALARISMFLEDAILDDKPAYGIAFDLAKAFDNVPIEVTFAICAKVGMHPRLYTGLKGMYDRITRRFKIGDYVGKTFKDTNGILQGCPLSVMLLNLLMMVLSNVLSPHVINESFVDDLTVLTGSVENLQKATDAVHEFMVDTAQKVNQKKTYAFGPKGGADVLYNGTLIPKKAEVKVLGVKFRFDNGRLDLRVEDAKVRDAIATANRIRYSNLPFVLRTMLNGSLVMSKVLYGVEVQDLTPGDERRLRTAVGFSIWQKTSKQRSPGLLFTLPTKGHVVDPAQAPHVRRLMAVQRCAHYDEGLRKQLAMLWTKLERKRRFRTGGFVENLLYSTKRLAISVDISENSFDATIGGVTMDAYAVPSLQWAHHCREGARLAVWKMMDKERAREGRIHWRLSDGINRSATMKYYNQTSAVRQGILRKILLNGVWTQARRAKMPDSDGDPTCACGAAIETIEHLWWNCSRWQAIREQHQCLDFPQEEYSHAFRDLGIELITDPKGNATKVQKMMVDIFSARFGNLE